MRRRADALGPAAAAAAAALTAVLGGGFWPGQRLAVGAALVVVWALAAWRWTRSVDRVEGGVLALLTWGVVSAVVVGAAPLASKETLTVWLIGAALWAVSRRAGGRARQLAIRILTGCAAVVAAAVLVAAAAAGSIRTGGLFENPNIAAALLVPTLPMGWLVFGRARHPANLAWSGLVVAGVVGTGSRAGLLGLLVIAVVALPRGRLRTIGVSTVAGLGAAALAWRFFSQPDLLAWHRVSIWGAVVKIWAARPLTGVGPGSLVEAAGVERILHPDQVGRYQFVVGVAESTPLAILVQIGLIGLVIAAIVSVLWVSEARRSGALQTPPVRAAVTAAAFFALFHDLLTADPVLWWWAVLAGCIERPFQSDDDDRREISTGVIRWTLGLAMIWLTAWGLVAPAYARLVFVSAPPTTDLVKRALRAEPWLDEAPAARVRALLALTEGWSWRTGADALHWAETARRAHPGLARRWADVGVVRLRILTDCGGTESDAAAAVLAFDRACELDPRLPWHWLERARLERVVGHHDAAIAYCLRALDEEPNTVRGWLMLARLELELGRVDAARDALDEAISRAGLTGRPGLTDYERELLQAPSGLIGAVERALIDVDAGESVVDDRGRR